MVASKRKNWTDDDMRRAIEHAEKGNTSIRKAAAEHGVPRSTLQLYISTNATVGRRHDPPTVLTVEEEQKLVDWIQEMAAIGYGQTRQQVLEMVKKIMDSTVRSNPFKDNRPGKDWWYAFLKRHPVLSTRTPQALQDIRATTCTPKSIQRWFSEYEQLLLKYDLLDKPTRIWNCDKSGFSLSPKPGKV